MKTKIILLTFFLASCSKKSNNSSVISPAMATVESTFWGTTKYFATALRYSDTVWVDGSLGSSAFLKMGFILPTISDSMYSFDSSTSWLTFANSVKLPGHFTKFWVSSMSIWMDTTGTYDAFFSALSPTGQAIEGSFYNISIPPQ